MIRCPDNQINASFIDISRIKWLVFLLWSSFFRTTSTVASSGRLSAHTQSNRRSSGEASKTMDYKSVFTNLCLELQQNKSWINGLGKNPQKSELIHWRQCLLSGSTEVCSLGLRETPACIHVIQRLSQPRVACWHGFRQNSQKTERCPTSGRKKNCVFKRPPKRRG